MIPSEPIVESTTTFPSGGRPIRVEQFQPEAPGRCPAVLVLHGSGGMDFGGTAFLSVAGELARRGYVAQVVRYFDRTGTRFADDRSSRAHFADWMATVGDAIAFAAARPEVDPDRIGLLGFSLGGYLALAVAATDPRVKAVVEFFGGFPEALAEHAPGLPPTLVLHGEADVIVPVREARALQRLLEAHGIPHRVHLYPGAGHGFGGPEGIDAARRTLAFFDEHLRP